MKTLCALLAAGLLCAAGPESDRLLTRLEAESTVRTALRTAEAQNAAGGALEYARLKLAADYLAEDRLQDALIAKAHGQPMQPGWEAKLVERAATSTPTR